MNTAPAKTDTDYRSMIDRAASDPHFDLDKFERLVAVQEAQEQRAADRFFNVALASAESEMGTIATDANNPQTRSRYATFARLDGAIRDIYTRHGFSISFNTEPTGDPNSVRVVGTLSQSMVSRRFQIDVPIDTKGMRGQDMMTRTHATLSAISYGKRNLEIMMFNLAIGDDDDGNAAGRRLPPNPNLRPINRPPDNVNPETGEITELEHQTPGMILLQDGEAWVTWVPRFMRSAKTAANRDEVQQWLDLNTNPLALLKQEKPTTYANVMATFTSMLEKLS
jgi:hypothetical protein